MNICFYTYSSDHLFLDVLFQCQKFKRLFGSSKHYFIADNRVHLDAYQSRNYEILYLSDIDYKGFIDYPPSDNRLISMKRYTLIDKPAVHQENVFFSFHKKIENYIVEKKIDLVVFPQQIQSMEGTLILSIAKKNRIKVAVPHGTRLKHIAYFNDSEQANLPIFERKLEKSSYDQAKKLRDYFIKNNRLPYPFSQKPPFKRKNILLRLINRIKRTIYYGEEFEFPDFVFSVKQNLPLIQKTGRKWNKRKVKKFFNLNYINELPEKFIYFPLQLYPEASIHIPSPFFKHQERVIDLIRLSLPIDYKLIVKEHPLMEGRRSQKFYKALSRKSGVRLINTEVDSNQIIRRSSLTISVSGTAVLEAYLLKKPSFSIGETTFSNFTNTIKVDLNDMEKTISCYINKKISENEILKNLALLYQNTFHFNNYSIEYDPKFTRSEKNISNYLKALDFFLKQNYPVVKKK